MIDWLLKEFLTIWAVYGLIKYTTIIALFFFQCIFNMSMDVTTLRSGVSRLQKRIESSYLYLSIQQQLKRDWSAATRIVFYSFFFLVESWLQLIGFGWVAAELTNIIMVALGIVYICQLSRDSLSATMSQPIKIIIIKYAYEYFSFYWVSAKLSRLLNESHPGVLTHDHPASKIGFLS